MSGYAASRGSSTRSYTMLLVTGANGTTGSELIKLLSSMKISTRAMVRDPSKAGEIDLPCVNTVAGDLSRPETLTGIMAGVEKVYLVSSLAQEMPVLHRNLIEAAKKAGVRHIVRHSGVRAGVNSPSELLRSHGEAEKILEDSGIPWTHLRPAYFMQNFLGFMPFICESGIIPAPVGDGKISMIDVRDIARVAAIVLAEEGHEGKTYELRGPEALSFGGCASILGKAMGMDISFMDVKPSEALEGMIKSGYSRWVAEALVELYGLFRDGYSETVNSTVEEITGRKPSTFERFARDYSHALVCEPVAA